MNLRNFGGSIWLLLFGTATVLLIGAFARFDTPGAPTVAEANPQVAESDFAATNVAITADPAAGPTVGPTLPTDLSPGLAEIIKLAQAHIGDDTILIYIQNSGLTYTPSANELLYLSDIGVSEKVLAALVKKPDAAAVAVAATTNAPPAAPPPVSAATAMTGAPDNMIDTPLPTDDQPAPVPYPQNNYFYDSLSPYGSWVNVGDGYAWQPTVAAADSSWQPYVNRGQWALTDDGWYWASDYSWGWAPFHYGRWSDNPQFGWVWVPGNVWAPAWVAWRGTEGFAGWAALPPGVLFRPGVGLFSVAGLPGLAASFGISAERFTFVPNEHFLSRNLRRFATPGKSSAQLFQSSRAIGSAVAANGGLRNAGVSVETIAKATKAPVPKLAVHEASLGTSSGGAGKDLAVYRPNVATSVSPHPSSGSSKPLLINGPSPASRAPFIASNFKPAPTRQYLPDLPPTPSFASRNSFGANGGPPVALPREPAPAANYPSFNPNQRNYEATPENGNYQPSSESGFSQRAAPSYNSPPPSAQRGSQSYTAPARSSAPSYNAPAPSHSSGSGGGNSGGSSSSSSSSKNSK